VRIAEKLIKIADKLVRGLTLDEQFESVEEFKGEGFVYLIHFNEPFKHAKHYVGWTTDVESRILCHKEGRGARLMQVLNENGIDWQLVRVWEGASRGFERKIKNMKKTSLYCPICNPNVKDKLYEVERFCSLR